MPDRTPSNVVRFDDAERRRDAPSTGEAIRLLNGARDMLAERLDGVLATFIERIDDSLFDLANKADGEAQNDYFQAMRELRIKKELFMRQFGGSLIENADRRVRRAFGDDRGTAGGGLELTLMDEADLEYSVAAANVVARLAAAAEDELYALNQRASLLLRRAELELIDNPLGPQVIAESFRAACNELEAALEIKLILFKLLERALAPEMTRIYRDINLYLVDSGVLPRVQVEVRKESETPRERRPEREAQPQTAAGGPQGAGPGPAAGGAPDIFGVLQQLLTGALLPGAAGGATPAPQLAPVMSALTGLQHGAPAGAPGQLPVDAATLAAGNVNVLHQLRGAPLVRSLSETDALTLDVVSMLFDYILDDEDIPPALKALIGRLQIPVLKAAIIDKGIFSRKTHPVRRLLDGLAQVSIGWAGEPTEEDPLYRQVHRSVHRVLDEFDDDVELFSRVLVELEAFRNRSEQVAGQAAEGSAEGILARERLSAAWTTAQDQVALRTAVDGLPEAVTRFLGGHWKGLLALIYVREGPEAPAWRDALDTMDELLWSVAPKADNREREQLIAALPDLIHRLQAGMDEMEVGKSERRRFLSALAALHAAGVRSDPASRPAPAAAPPASPEEAVTDQARLLRFAVETANVAIHKAARVQSEYSGMGATLVAALLGHGQLTVAHVGDSRLYRFRAGRLEQITRDHTLLQYLIDRDFYTPEEARKAGKKSQMTCVTRALGIESEVIVDLAEAPVAPGDLYLLCSDGLTDMLRDEFLLATLKATGEDLAGAAQRLIDLANHAGGQDNVSAVLVRIPPDGSGAPEMAAVTDTGRKRSHNEDAVGIEPALGAAVIADGMGGYNAGEVAAAIAVNRVLGMLRQGLMVEGTSAEAAALAGDEPLPEPPAPRHDEFSELVEALPIGAWVEFPAEDGALRRARLSWISPAGGTYLFTDSHGAKVADGTLTGLAEEFRRGAVRLLDDVPLFDRAVGSLLSRLRAGGQPSGNG